MVVPKLEHGPSPAARHLIAVVVQRTPLVHAVYHVCADGGVVHVRCHACASKAHQGVWESPPRGVDEELRHELPQRFSHDAHAAQRLAGHGEPRVALGRKEVAGAERDHSKSGRYNEVELPRCMLAERSRRGFGASVNC